MDGHGGGEAPSEAAFRQRARTFLAGRLARRRHDGLPQVMGAGSDDLSGPRAFLELLGPWAVPTWPEAAGGLAASLREAAIVAEELARFEAPDLYPFMVGLSLVGPAVLEHGTAEQQARWLPAIRAGAEIWCQLFSEPGAGSDLAALACRAVPSGGSEWRVTGQKVWSSRAHYSRWGPEPVKACETTFHADLMSASGVGSLIQAMVGSFGGWGCWCRNLAGLVT